MTLGRPRLLPQHLVRIENTETPSQTAQARGTAVGVLDNSAYIMSFTYARFSRVWLCVLSFAHVLCRSSCHILGSAIELLYDDNVEGPHLSDVYKLVSNRLQLSCQLEEWRQSITSFGGLVSPSELSPDPPIMHDSTLRLRILLTIQYYRIAMLINYPIIAALLDHCVKKTNNEPASEFLREAATPVVKNDLLAAKELCRILHTVTKPAALFLDPTTDWWTCNYTSQ